MMFNKSCSTGPSQWACSQRGPVEKTPPRQRVNECINNQKP
jgi:hypothetical protein